MTEQPESTETPETTLETTLERWFVGPRDPRYRRVVFGFLLATAAHLWIADTWQEAWIIPDLILALGVVVLFVAGGMVGWLLCALGLLIPLLFLRDQLTQSMLMLAMSLLGAWVTCPAFKRELDDAASAAFIKGMQGLTILTYGLATFHKLNADFLNPYTSCANYGVDELLTYFRMEGLFDPWSVGWLPVAALLVEGGVAVAYLFGRRRVAWMLAAVFHLPITLTMAPAFVMVMLPGHLAFVRPADDLRWAERTFPHLKKFGIATVSATAISLAIHGALPEISMIFKEALIWFFLFTTVWAFPPWTRHAWVGRGHGRMEPPEKNSRAIRLAPYVICAGFLVNGFTPYLGVQFQHTAAMLSNLRIDEGCWNHALIPEGVRVREDYVRIDTVWFEEPGKIEEYENIVLEQLWSPPQILQMRRNWCRDEIRPFHISGTFRGRRFTVEDVCIEEPLPFPDDGIFDVSVFPDFLRYQKNLMRECPQRCIH